MQKHNRIFDIIENLKELDDDDLKIVEEAVRSCYIVQTLKKSTNDNNLIRNLKAK